MIKHSSYSLEHIGFEGKSAIRGRAPQPPEPKLHGDPACLIQAATNSMPMVAFAARVLESAGLRSEAYRTRPINRRLAACMRTLKADSLVEAQRILARNPGLNAQAVDSLLIGTTEFSRDAPVFEALQKIISEERSFHQRSIRIWSAGCSNGAELYSVAMLLAEAGLLKCSELVGTDCRPAAIREARAGFYSESSVRSMNEPLREKYMQRGGAQWRIAESLQVQARWRVKNLLSGCEKGPWDIILWRNMAIYLKQAYAHCVWNAIIGELRIGGWLVVGKAERPPSLSGLACISPCVYQLKDPPADAISMANK